MPVTNTKYKNAVWILLLLILFACNPKEIEISVGSGEPYESIQEALISARQIRSSDASAHITIHILPGTYYLKPPLIITPEM